MGMGENQESAAVVLAPLDQTVLPAPEAPKRRKSEPLSALSLQDYQEANPFLFVKDANTSAYVDLTKDETSPPPQQRTKPGKKTKKGGNKSKGLVLPPKTKKLIDKLNNLGVPFENVSFSYLLVSDDCMLIVRSSSPALPPTPPSISPITPILRPRLMRCWRWKKLGRRRIEPI